MKIPQNKILDLLCTKPFCTSDSILEYLSIPNTNNNRLYLSSVLQKDKRIKLSYRKMEKLSLRVYSLSKDS